MCHNRMPPCIMHIRKKKNCPRHSAWHQWSPSEETDAYTKGLRPRLSVYCSHSEYVTFSSLGVSKMWIGLSGNQGEGTLEAVRCHEGHLFCGLRRTLLCGYQHSCDFRSGQLVIRETWRCALRMHFYLDC